MYLQSKCDFPVIMCCIEHIVKCLYTAQGLGFIIKWPSGDQYTNNGCVARQVFKIANEYYTWEIVIIAEW